MNRYLVMAIRKATFQQAAVEKHCEFLDQLRREGKLEVAGPFGDKSGGAYLLNVESMEAAEAIAFSDPMHTTNSSVITVYAWDAK